MGFEHGDYIEKRVISSLFAEEKPWNNEEDWFKEFASQLTDKLAEEKKKWMVRGNELIRNQTIMKQLKATFEEDFYISDNKASINQISKFHSSKEDFSLIPFLLMLMLLLS